MVASARDASLIRVKISIRIFDIDYETIYTAKISLFMFKSLIHRHDKAKYDVKGKWTVDRSCQDQA